MRQADKDMEFAVKFKEATGIKLEEETPFEYWIKRAVEAEELLKEALKYLNYRSESHRMLGTKIKEFLGGSEE